MHGPAFARRHAADDPCPIRHGFLGVERRFVAGESLDDDRRGLINEYAHIRVPASASTARHAASASVSAVVIARPLCFKIRRPSSTLVPASLAMIGTVNDIS